MSSMLSIGARSEGNVEVHKFYGGMALAVAFLSVVLQAFLHKYGRWSELVDLPLLVTIYFGVSRQKSGNRFAPWARASAFCRTR